MLDEVLFGFLGYVGVQMFMEVTVNSLESFATLDIKLYLFMEA